MRFELVNHSIVQLALHHAVLEERADRSLRRVNAFPVRSIADLRERFGIPYRAPRFAGTYTASELGPYAMVVIATTP